MLRVVALGFIPVIQLDSYPDIFKTTFIYPLIICSCTPAGRTAYTKSACHGPAHPAAVFPESVAPASAYS
jgi:hypothetical protein